MNAREELESIGGVPAMLAMSKALNPELRHVEGDMRDVRLGAAPMERHLRGADDHPGDGHGARSRSGS